MNEQPNKIVQESLKCSHLQANQPAIQPTSQSANVFNSAKQMTMVIVEAVAVAVATLAAVALVVMV